MERADGILRMLKINYASSQDDIQEFSWKPVLKIFTFLKEEEANALAQNNRAVLQFMENSVYLNDVMHNGHSRCIFYSARIGNINRFAIFNFYITI